MSTPIPPQLTIPIGAESSGEITRLVDIGEQVLKYQKLAVISLSAKGRSDVPVHAHFRRDYFDRKLNCC